MTKNRLRAKLRALIPQLEKAAIKCHKEYAKVASDVSDSGAKSSEQLELRDWSYEVWTALKDLSDKIG